MPPLNDNVVEYSQASFRQNNSDELYSPASSFRRRTLPRDSFAGSTISKPGAFRRHDDDDDGRRSSTNDKKHVRFNEEVNIHFVITVREITPDEIQKCWYNPSEYNDFKSDVAITVYLIKNNPESIDDIKYTRRGAEIRIDSILERRHNWKREARSEVFSEQYAQNMMGFVFKDEGKIATLYKVASQPAIMEAIELATIDRIEADSYHNQSQYQGTFPNIKGEEPSCSSKKRHRKKLSDFNDSWITSISSSSDDEDDSLFLDSSNCYHHSTTASATNHENPFLFDESGFDDSWIRDVSVECR